ncbi:malonic semialdehyde reductase [Duganella sp. FT80W]|uniref:Putative NADH dehydrogenase/NAD(P)H nitroreductase GJ699_32945 n=1 Tax=Duganella guangzhouensis TaxID=2666084 RepID=A0A6I2LAB6_9BURK|nr:malonic semialdehyde reductase [Duganella guangzhouensis]MRW94783.1 malonic semialdehyde reductase [Duganella guangzhouensis]
MLNQSALDTLFYSAHTHNGWQDRPLSDAQLQQLYDALRWAPTAANGAPARFVFVRSAEAKARLAPALSAGNLDKTLAAPVTVIVGMDTAFYEKLPQLSPAVDARSWFVGNEALIQSTAFRNSSLQGAYLMLAARALGLDVGPMSGFDNAKVDAAFFAGTSIQSNFICNIGYGDPAKIRPRAPRLAFDEACQIV